MPEDSDKQTDPDAPMTYREAGVDQEAADSVIASLKSEFASTFSPNVIGSVGAFAGLYALGGAVTFSGGPSLLEKQYSAPVLVACTDGVGTKLKIAFMLDKHDTVGIDLVAMNVNDLITQGARPLIFLDYLATGELRPEVVKDIIRGIAAGCRQSYCSLIGGETAQMPDMYAAGEYDLAGFAVGMADRSRIPDGSRTVAGDAVIGIESAGLHSNGYTLVRRVLLDKANMKLDAHIDSLGCPLGEELLRPTKIYAESIARVLAYYKVKEVVRSISHVTGGGIAGNLSRNLPKTVNARIDRSSWQVPPVFDLVAETGEIEREEMFATFNMGIGMILVCSAYYADSICRTVGASGVDRARAIGSIVEGEGKVEFVDSKG